MDAIFRKLYEDNALGKIPDDQYRLLSDSYTAELHELKAKIPELQNQINEIKTEESNLSYYPNILLNVFLVIFLQKKHPQRLSSLRVFLLLFIYLTYTYLYSQ